MQNPTYRNHGKHIEALKVVYDPKIVSYDALLTAFWHSIDPTDAGGQFCDRGHTYTTAIFAILACRGLSSGLLPEKPDPLSLLPQPLRPQRDCRTGLGTERL